MTKEEYAKRNAEIYRMYSSEWMTLSAIGKRFNISRERVRQIIERIREGV